MLQFIVTVFLLSFVLYGLMEALEALSLWVDRQGVVVQTIFKWASIASLLAALVGFAAFVHIVVGFVSKLV